MGYLSVFFFLLVIGIVSVFSMFSDICQFSHHLAILARAVVGRVLSSAIRISWHITQSSAKKNLK